jgi:hypothetical protein
MAKSQQSWLGSIPTSTDTVEYEGQRLKSVSDHDSLNSDLDPELEF